MTLGSSIKSLVEGMLRGARITSASPPPYYNKVDAVNWYSEITDFDSVLAEDVVNIIKAEIKIQMTEQKDTKAEATSEPSGSTDKAISKAKMGMGIVQNPQTLVAMGLKTLPYAAVVLFATELIPIIIQEISRPGSIMDLRWKRMMAMEMNAFMDRQTQRDTQIGLRQIIATSEKGRIARNGGVGTYNNQKEIRENDNNLANRIGIKQHATGTWFP